MNKFCFVLLFCGLTSGLQAQKLSFTEELARENLARVPATDLKAENPPTLLPGLEGRHPRLLFTPEQLARLKTAAQTDPVLKEATENLVSGFKRSRGLGGNPPGVVLNDTAALSVSLANLAGLSVAYPLDPDPVILENIQGVLQVMLAEPYWARSVELDCNMGAGNNMLMVGLLFDAVADELEPELRKALAEKMFTHVRRMYWLGHQQKSLQKIKYWQQDPQNNHRWHRNAGMTACLLAIMDEPGLDVSYMLEQHKKEMDFIFTWYPEDGDCHEGRTYQQFGFFYLAVAARMMDQNLGTDYLSHPGLKNAWKQQLYYWVPGSDVGISFGDDQNRPGLFNHLSAPFFISPALSRDPDVQAIMNRYMALTRIRKDNGKSHPYAWTLPLFYDPDVKVGDYTNIPTHKLFGDLGAASLRDSWEENAVIFTFKCGPYGGFKLNEYRHTVRDADGNPHYINVAHDDPDANSFALAVNGDLVFHPGVYATKKMTKTVSTLTVNGAGQKGSGSAYTQPVGQEDMRELSYLTGWKEDAATGRVIVEGEAGNAYEDLQAFRRSVIWMPGDYILLLDRVRAETPAEITWRGTAEQAQFVDPENGKATAYVREGEKVDFQILASQPFKGAIDYMYLHGRWGALLMHQLQFSAETESLHFAALFDPWKKGVELERTETDGGITLTVTGEGIRDVWTCQAPKNGKTPSVISGSRNGKPLLTLSETDTAPRH